MYEFNIEIANIPIKIFSKHKYVYEQCYDYLTEKNPFFSVSLSNEDILKEMTIANKKVKTESDEKYLESTAIYRKICEKILDYDAFMMHSATVKLGDTAIAFIGKSGAGKTTQSMFWINEFGAEYINGDKPVIRLIDGSFFAFGTPWCGKERLNNNTYAKLEFLVQVVKSDKNAVQELSSYDALPVVLKQVHLWDDEISLSKIMDMIDKLLESVKVLRLYCKNEPISAHVAFEKIFNFIEEK